MSGAYFGVAMLRLLRSVRRSLMSGDSNPKFRSYLLYGLGEMALVVIGILIALQIGNWNEERADAEEVRGILREIRSDLIADARFLADELPDEMARTSAKRRVLRGELTRDDFATDGMLYRLPLDFPAFELRDNGWRRLAAFEGSVPKELEAARLVLDAYYERAGQLLALRMRAWEDDILRRHRFLEDQMAWYSDFRGGRTPDSDEIIDWFYSSYRYRNWVLRTPTFEFLDVALAQSLAAWTTLGHLLGDSIDHPLVPSDMMVPDTEAVAGWVGRWADASGQVRELTLVGGILYITWDAGRIPVVWTGTNTFRAVFFERERGWLFEMMRSGEGDMTLAVQYGPGGDSAVLRKIDG